MIEADEKLPGFAHCFDMDFVQRAVQEGLPALGEVKACQLERFRYRKQLRASFLYRVETRSGTDWVSGSLYRGKKSRGIFEAAAGHPATGYAAGVDMVLERFPHDRKLGLASELASGHCDDVLNAIAHVFGGRPTTLTEVVAIRYRPRISAVFRIAVSDEQMTRRFYVKSYADEDVGLVQHRLLNCEGGALFSILKPAAVVERCNTIIWPEVEGVSLVESLMAGGTQDAAEAGAAALAEFHRSAQTLPAIPPIRYAHEDASRHAVFISSVMPQLNGIVSALVDEIPVRFGDTPVGPFHHDMKPEHLLLCGNKAWFIDVEGISAGDPVFDVGNMLARISAGSWLYGLPASSCKRAFQVFLDHSLPSPYSKCAAAFALGKMKLATYAISHQTENWEAIATSELEYARSALGARAFA